MNYTYVVGKCLQLGMTIAGAIGCAVNIAHESAGRSNNVEDTFNTLMGVSDDEYVRQVDSGTRDFLAPRSGGFGLCQWTSLNRRKNLYDYLKGYGLSIADEQYQYYFMAKEMRASYPHVWFVLTHTDDPYEAAKVMCEEFEIPANTKATAKRRGEEARKLFPQLSGTAPAVEVAEESTTTAAKNATTDWPPRMICKGMNGADVMVLQALLVANGYTVNAVNGVFDESTDKATRRFQEDKHLTVDGVAGNNTWSAILAFTKVRR